MGEQEALKALTRASREACDKINAFSRDVFRTRGGRIGSGMGTVLEALWGYYVNETWQSLEAGPPDCELAWIVGHQYSDFACVSRSEDWDHSTGMGELFRVEAKSMNIGADEAKGHFDEVRDRIGELDQLLVFVWDWRGVDEVRVCPQIVDHFLGSARSVAYLRDELHVGRGGEFVDVNDCPDRCTPESCTHGGEPLNARGKRERRSGPESRRVSANVANAANFGGLVRMLKTNSDESRQRAREIREADAIANDYVSFIFRNFPDEERNHYRTAEWRAAARKLGIDYTGMRSEEVVKAVREAGPTYREVLQSIE